MRGQGGAHQSCASPLEEISVVQGGPLAGFLTRHQYHVRRAALQSIHPARVGESQRADQRIA